MMNLYGAHNHILALTDIVDADYHQHSFIQVSISLESAFELETAGKHIECNGVVIDSNVIHRFDCHHNKLLFLLIDNTSGLAKPFKKLISGNQIYVFPSELPAEIAAFVLDHYHSVHDDIGYEEFIAQLLPLLGAEYTDPEPADQRIIEVIGLLKENDGAGHSIDALAKTVSLSKSRLSHLFKESTGATLCGYMMLRKLQKAIYFILNGVSITSAALEAGFDSPSHFAATNKKLLGMSAKELTKDSVFLKVSRF